MRVDSSSLTDFDALNVTVNGILHGVIPGNSIHVSLEQVIFQGAEKSGENLSKKGRGGKTNQI